MDSAGNQGTCSEELAVVVTDIGNASTVPTVFALQQNYPNPFNPSSVIRFDVPQNSHVTIRVYDMLGREVATLVNEVMSVGQHSTTWNAGGLSSGFYVYRMTAGSFADTKKIILMK